MQSKANTSLIIYPQDNDVIFLDYAINNKLTPFISMQNHYNLIYREEEREMFPTLKVALTLLFRWIQPIVCSTLTWDRFHGRLLAGVF